MTLKHKILAVAVVVGIFLISLASLSTIQSHYEYNLKNAHDQAQELKGKIDQLAREGAELRQKLAAAEADLAQKRAAFADANQKAQKITVPDPRPVPATEPELTASLVASGMKTGLLVHADPFGPSTFGRGDATLAFQWKAQADRIPAFEEKTKAQEDALQKAGEAVSACLTVKDGQAVLLRVKDEQLSAQAERMKALDAVAMAATKEAKAAHRLGRLEAVGAFALGVFAGHRIK